VNDYGVNKAVKNLPKLREKLSAINDNYQNIQQDILETFIDRGQFTPTQPARGPPQWQADTRTEARPSAPACPDARTRPLCTHRGIFHVHAAEIYPEVVDALGCPAASYSLASLRYGLSKLRAKGLAEKLPHSRRYRLRPCGYSISLVFLKLFERIYAPLTAALLRPVAGDRNFQAQRQSQIDHLYWRVTSDLQKLTHAVGLQTAA